MLHTFWQTFISPVLRRPARFQVAALCYRRTAEGPEVLVLTSLHTKRWILPKGWPKTGLDAGGVAIEEAWEEAGVITRDHNPPRIGRYRYVKRLRGGVPVATEVDVFAIEVQKLHGDYPEVGRRERRWMSPFEAARAVDEPELKEVIERFPAKLQDGFRT
ncbi:NUDIX hydrolase [Pseudooceanicola nanhaiensis]|uniref:NUDIX hydrolase n=1 Tax=Pseudooceanicola nanhaiensis TaxID=375761 RepID=UPI004059D038